MNELDNWVYEHGAKGLLEHLAPFGITRFALFNYRKNKRKATREVMVAVSEFTGIPLACLPWRHTQINEPENSKF